MPTGPIEAKVKVATAATYLGTTALLADLTAIQDNPGLIGWLPAWLAPFVLPLIPTAATFLAGYRARHTPRSDADARAAADAPGA